jgi:hypothetical protein
MEHGCTMQRSKLAAPSVMGTLMAVQSYAAYRTWNSITDPSVIGVIGVSMIATLLVMCLAVLCD